MDAAMQFLPLLILSLGLLIPFWRIYRKAGFNPWWSLFVLVPFAFLVLPWVIAFARWPALQRARYAIKSRAKKGK